MDFNAETIKAIQDALAPVAAKIGEGAQYAWDVVVNQQYVIGISYLIWAAACAVAVWPMYTIAKRCWKKHEEEGDYSGWDIGGALVSLATIGIVIASIVCLTNGVMHILNPGYYALEFFITLGKSAVPQ